jgi:hypothetical protein
MALRPAVGDVGVTVAVLVGGVTCVALAFLTEPAVAPADRDDSAHHAVDPGRRFRKLKASDRGKESVLGRNVGGTDQRDYAQCKWSSPA